MSRHEQQMAAMNAAQLNAMANSFNLNNLRDPSAAASAAAMIQAIHQQMLRGNVIELSAYD